MIDATKQTLKNLITELISVTYMEKKKDKIFLIYN
jgi:hypothetical protein